jgi:hypothetical protein
MMPSFVSLSSQKRFLILAALSVAPFFAVMVFVYQTKTPSMPHQFVLGIAPRSGVQVAEAAAASVKPAPMLEVHIANNGAVLLRDARVVSIDGDNLRVAMSWEVADFIWLVQTSPTLNTSFLRVKGEKGALIDIRVGDFITITGKLVSSGGEPTITAQIIRM